MEIREATAKDFDDIVYMVRVFIEQLSVFYY